MSSALVGLLDPSIGTRNEGDVVIQDSIWAALRRLNIDRDDVATLPTQRPMSAAERQSAARCTHFFVGGTNLLSSNMPFYMQWKLRPWDLRVFRRNVLLLGVGWWQYQGPANSFTRALLSRVLAVDGHSVRDEWSRMQLAGAGMEGINTACPTMWDLPQKPELRTQRGSEVIVTLTDYNRKPALDLRLLELLGCAYDRVSIWPQGSRDQRYCRKLRPHVGILDPGLAAFEARLQAGADYVGTRLHAGIRALQLGARATIVAVDNRASEIARDTKLPVVSRDLRSEDEQFLLSDRQVRLAIPRQAIDTWVTNTQRWLAGSEVD